MRHARPRIGHGICYGALDIPADAEATAASAVRLAQALPQGVLVRHSPLQRCVQLAQAMHQLRPDIHLAPDSRLQEMNFGTWEGQAWEAIGQDAIDAWTADFTHHAPGGGESLSAMLRRVAAAFEDTRARATDDSVWITHAGVTRCVDWLITHGQGTPAQASQWPVEAPAWGDWNVRTLDALGQAGATAW